MGPLNIFEIVSLDGVMQGPGRPDEDTRGGFPHSGWCDGYADDAVGRFTQESVGGTEALLLGHRTYDDLLHHWTVVSGPNPYADVLLNQQKYGTSRDADTKLDYPNSTLLAGDAAAAVARLKKETDDTLTVLSSGELVRSLHRAGLIDDYLLLIHPIVAGSGTRLFGDDEKADLNLKSAETSTTGVLLARYSSK